MTLTTCVGFALGLRFNFLILYPATILAAIGTAVHSGPSGDGIGATMLTMSLDAAAVQMGYVFGVIMRCALATDNEPRSERDPKAVNRSNGDSALLSKPEY